VTFPIDPRNDFAEVMTQNSLVKMAQIEEIERLLWLYRHPEPGNTDCMSERAFPTLTAIRNVIFNIHEWQTTDNQGHNMSCTRCGRSISYYVPDEWAKQDEFTCYMKAMKHIDTYEASEPSASVCAELALNYDPENTPGGE
jgi:hypothetical protein